MGRNDSRPEITQVNPRSFDSQPSADEIVSFVPMASVEEETGHFDPSSHRPFSDVSKGYTRFQDGDVIFAKITPCMENGKCAVMHGLKGGRGAGSTEFHVLRPREVSPELLFYFLVQKDVRRAARLKMKGAAGQLRVPPEFIESLPFRLPPLSEQYRIVAAIEALLTDLDAAVTALRRVQANLKRYRASVLKAACEGRLVPTEAELARKEGRTYENGEQLLARILKERRAKWEGDQLAKMVAAGKSPQNDEWNKKYAAQCWKALQTSAGIAARTAASLREAQDHLTGEFPSRGNRKLAWVSSGRQRTNGSVGHLFRLTPLRSHPCARKDSVGGRSHQIFLSQ